MTKATSHGWNIARQAKVAGDAPEKPMVPSAKVMLLGSIGLILMMSIGGLLGFSDVANVFQDRLDDASAYESGWTGPLGGEDGVVTCSIGIDMKRDYNATHGIVYWYLNITVPLYSNIAVVLDNLQNAEVVEVRIFEQANQSNWVSVFDYEVENYLWDIEYYNFTNYWYIHRIDTVAEDPGEMKQWLVYRWLDKTQNFEYVVQSTSKFLPSDYDLVVLLFGELGVLPIDCCSGSSFQYEGYEGPK